MPDIPGSHLPQLDRQAIEALLEQQFVMEPAVLEEDIDAVRMRAKVRLKRRLVTGEVGGGSTQERQAQPIFECPVLLFKNKNFIGSRLRYKKGDDVVVLFSSRAKDNLIKRAHVTNVEAGYKRAMHVQDAFVLLGFMADEGEPLAPKDHSDELGLNATSMGIDDHVLHWGRYGSAGWGSRIYAKPDGNIVIHPAIGRNVYLVEDAQYNVLFAQPCASKYNQHANFGTPGPGDPPVLPAFWWFPVTEWTINVFADNAFKF